MDTLTWTIVGGLALLAVVATLYILNRSWGSFPRDARYQPRSGASAPGASSPPAGPAAGLVPIEHPLVRRSAEQALTRGGTATRYIVRQGNDLFFDFSQIDDPAKRQQAYDMMRRFNAGQDVDVRATIALVRELFGQ